MTDVFISYSKKASEPTKALATLLEKLGYAVWWDKALLAGRAFNDTIREKLDEAGAIVVIWTPESAASDYVKLEAGIGWFRNKLIALRISDLRMEEIPAIFQSIHTIDANDIGGIVSALEHMGVQPSVEKTGKIYPKKKLCLRFQGLTKPYLQRLSIF
jgi:TIR domain